MQVCQSAFCILQSALLHFALNAVWNSKSSSVHSQLVCCPSTCAHAPSSRGCVVLRVTARESETVGTSQGMSYGKGADTLQLFWVCPSWLGGGEKKGYFVLPLGGAVFYGALLRWCRERCWGLGNAAGRSETHWEAFRELLTSDERTPKVTRDHEGWSSPSRFPGMSIFHRNPWPYEDVASGV